MHDKIEKFTLTLGKLFPEEIINIIVESETYFLSILETLELNSELCCPITQELIFDPYCYSFDGKIKFTFEEEAIRQWQKEHSICPITRNSLKSVYMHFDSRFRIELHQIIIKALSKENWLLTQLRQKVSDERIFAIAVKGGYIDLLKQLSPDLIQRLMNEVNEETDRSCFLDAVSDGHFEVVQYLLEQGADINVKAPSGKDILELAIQNNDLDLIKLIFEQYSETFKFKSTIEYVFLSVDNAYFCNERQEIIHYLIEKLTEQEINAQDSRGETVLYKLCNKHNAEEALITHVLNKGADINLCNSAGNTPLHAAALTKYSANIVALLISHHSNLTLENSNQLTPLNEALSEFNKVFGDISSWHEKKDMDLLMDCGRISAYILQILILRIAGASYSENLVPTFLKSLFTSSQAVKAFLSKHGCKELVDQIERDQIEKKDVREINFANRNLENVDLSNIDLNQKSMRSTNLTGANLTAVNLQNANLIGSILKDTNLAKAQLVNAKFDKNQLLTASSLYQIKIDRKTLVKTNRYSDQDVFLLQKKMVSDYKERFSGMNFQEVLVALHALLIDDKHVLRMEGAKNWLSNYGKTDAFSAVIDYGRKRLVDLAKHNQISPLAEDCRSKLNQIFNQNVYSFSREVAFFGMSNNAKQALQFINNKIDNIASEEVSYSFMVSKQQ